MSTKDITVDTAFTRRPWLQRAAVLSSSFCLGSLLPVATFAQSRVLTPMQAVGVFSMLGDAVQISFPNAPPNGTNITRSEQQSFEFKNIGFDIIATKVARQVLEKERPKAEVNSFRSTASLEPKAQRELAEGASRGELPDWMVRTIVDKKLTHALVITRNRGEADIYSGDGYSVGRGKVEGIGFYIDKLYRVKNTTTGAIADGLIAPYIQLRLTLLDTQTAQVVASYDVREGRAVGTSEERAGNDPWLFLTATEKVTVLRELLEDGMTRGVTGLLKVN
jgi:hypothetical protein